LALLFVSQCSAQNLTGFYWWTWSDNPNVPSNTNAGIAFSGWVNPAQAVSDSNAVKNSLPGTKYISVGGGNKNGAWTSSAVTAVTNAFAAGTFNGYGGICYDVEEGDSGLSGVFETSFAAAKSHGFKVLVTISHSAPYGIGDAGTLMKSFFQSSNIDWISPQLYTSGDETKNDYTTSGGVSWNQYAGSIAKIAPSIVTASLYSSAVSYFQGQGVTLYGYVQWAN